MIFSNAGCKVEGTKTIKALSRKGNLSMVTENMDYIRDGAHGDKIKMSAERNTGQINL